ncbi:MAG: prolyl oligopeptidase family serine peptidase [Rhodothermales bacterium]
MRRRTLLLALFLFAASSAWAQDGYMEPAPALKALVDAPLTPNVSIGPDARTMLLMTPQDVPTIAQLAEPELRLAGTRINPANNGPSRSSYATAMAIASVDGGAERPVMGIPAEGWIGYGAWSPDGTHYAFPVTFSDRIELYVLELGNGRARQALDRPLNGVGGRAFTWMPDSRTLLVRATAADRGAMPTRPAVPATPVIQENIGKEAPARTYQDLLETPYDEDLFAWLMASDLLRVSLDGTVQDFGASGMITSMDPSPDGRFVLTETVHRPFSYLVPWSRFPNRIEVYTAEGLPVRVIEDQPLMEEVPTGFGSTTTGVRSIGWRQDAPAMLAWVEALDGGDGNVEVDLRDAVMVLPEPFEGDATTLVRLPLRYAGMTWSDEGYVLVSERWTSTREFRTYRVSTDGTGGDPAVVFDYSYEDRYANPGSPMTDVDARGRRLLLTEADGNVIYLTGQGSSPDGDRPFLRRYDMRTGETEELFRSEAPYYERPVAWLDAAEGTFLTLRESNAEPPNYFVRSVAGGEPRAVTNFPHPYPEMDAISKESISYDRGDGVPLSATLYLPAGYDKDRDGPLPALVWAYPREFKSAAAAGQMSGSPYTFKRVSYSGAVPYVTQGYAVIDNASMPIIGEGDAEPNDTFVEQLVMNAQAVIDEGVRRGVVDPERVAIAGHSYGAFMTANLLAHSDLFRAGIARSGAYNRSLTPFGFQAEPRTFWEAPEIYFEMSPFMNADKVNEPILLIHGVADNNSGTFPIQSERFYHALKGNGSTARLVMLPHESHGYRARESLLHVLWETHTWLDTHVKNAPDRGVEMKKPTG